MSTHPVSSYETQQRGYIGMEGVGSSNLDEYSYRIQHDSALADDANSGDMGRIQRGINAYSDALGRIKDQNNPYHNYSEFQKYMEFTRTESSHAAVMRGLG